MCMHSATPSAYLHRESLINDNVKEEKDAIPQVIQRIQPITVCAFSELYQEWEAFANSSVVSRVHYTICQGQ